ncbi:cytochrome c-type biogenesis protein [Sphingomonas sp. LaA6.9]|uniref:cytochrome c-type biogenesis protein n=1 Tax=Sphingomonas sp. LaA6.9 TaxID=2919914 RepID=UPI00387E800E
MRALLALMLIAAPVAALADSAMPAAELADTQLPDPRQEAKAVALMETLRCVVCQGQSIADSDAEIAGDMRAMVRERIQKGESPEAIRAWMIERYGEWVSYKPGFSAGTAPLWIAPLLLLATGIWLARGRLRVRKKR